MALPEHEKLEIVRKAFKAKLLSFNEWATFKAFLQNITKAQIKTFILNTLQDAETAYDAQASAHTTTADDIGELYAELDTDM